MADIPSRPDREPPDKNSTSKGTPPGEGPEVQSEEDLPEEPWLRALREASGATPPRKQSPTPRDQTAKAVPPSPRPAPQSQAPSPPQASRQGEPPPEDNEEPWLRALREASQASYRPKPPAQNQPTRVAPQTPGLNPRPSTPERRREDPSKDYWLWPKTRSGKTTQAPKGIPGVEGPREARGDRQTLPAILFLLGIVLAELATGLADPDPLSGMILHSLLLFALMGQSAISYPNPRYKFYLSLSLVPIIRLLSLATPLSVFTPIYSYIVISIPLLIGAFIAIRTIKYNRSEVYLTTGNIPLQLLLPPVGVALGIAFYYISGSKPDPLVESDSLSVQSFLVPALILILTTGFTMELVFRGVLLRSSVEAFGNRGIFLAAAAFAALHIAGLDVIEIAVAFVMGLLFCWAVKQSKAIWGAVVASSLFNITVYLVAQFYF